MAKNKISDIDLNETRERLEADRATMAKLQRLGEEISNQMNVVGTAISNGERDITHEMRRLLNTD